MLSTHLTNEHKWYLKEELQYETQRECLGEILDRDANYRLGKRHADQTTTRENEDEKRSSRRKKRRRKFEKPEINGQVYFLDNLHKVESS
jgi:hypothetical protein